jgi:tol-pal system protein YbgF
MIRLARVGLLALMTAGCLGSQAGAQDSSEFIVRLNRMEGQVRTLSGQVEQLQFENRQLKENLRKFQEDVEFRFQERGGSRSAAPAAEPPSGTGATPGSGGGRPGRRSDAFDPSAQPGAPGAPRQLSAGTGGSTGSGARDGIASLIEEDGPRRNAPLDLSAAARSGNPDARPNAGQNVAATGSTDARQDYDAAYAYILNKQYDQAEAGLRRFVQSHPRDRLVPDAIFWLGESYLQRNRPREAAEQFLKVSTEHTRTAKAPDAFLKLGISLSALGAKDQACATFAELERKYPNAGPSVKQGVEREQKRARCPG